jgi:hypothetical protein
MTNFDQCPVCNSKHSQIEQVRVLYGNGDHTTFQKVDITAKGFSQAPYKIKLPYRLDGISTILYFYCENGHTWQREFYPGQEESKEHDNLLPIGTINKPFSFQPVNNQVCLPLEFAILNLEKIGDDYPNKDAALLHVIEWCKSNLTNKHQRIVGGKTAEKMGHTNNADAAAHRI